MTDPNMVFLIIMVPSVLLLSALIIAGIFFTED